MKSALLSGLIAFTLASKVISKDDGQIQQITTTKSISQPSFQADNSQPQKYDTAKVVQVKHWTNKKQNEQAIPAQQECT